jgi:hypothetical protein
MSRQPLGKMAPKRLKAAKIDVLKASDGERRMNLQCFALKHPPLEI